MYFILFVFSWAFGVVVLPFEASAQAGSPGLSSPAFTEAPKGAIIQWLTEQDHDFGAIRKDRPVKFVFQFKNISPEPIVLETVRTSCGCTAAEWPEAPIGPGETGEINIEYDAYMGGAFRKKIRVFFVQQKKPEILWISGETE